MISRYLVSVAAILWSAAHRSGVHSFLQPSTTTSSSPARRGGRRAGRSSSARRRRDDAALMTPPRAATSTRLSQQLRYEIANINSPADLTNFLSIDDRLCVVKVHANWCQICKAFDLHYRKFANLESDKLELTGTNVVVPGRVRFAEIEYGANEEFCKSLKATKIPHVFVFKGGMGGADEGKLIQFQCGPSVFRRVHDTVNYYLGTPTHDQAVVDLVGNLLEEGTELGRRAVVELEQRLAEERQAMWAEEGWDVISEQERKSR